MVQKCLKTPLRNIKMAPNMNMLSICWNRITKQQLISSNKKCNMLMVLEKLNCTVKLSFLKIKLISMCHKEEIKLQHQFIVYYFHLNSQKIILSCPSIRYMIENIKNIICTYMQRHLLAVLKHIGKYVNLYIFFSWFLKVN